MTDEAITIMAKAMETKRAELIERPIARIYPDLATAALDALRAAGYWVERWGPIEEAPKDEAIFMGHDSDAGITAITRFGRASHVPMNGWIRAIGDDDDDLWCPRYYTPLPPPPLQTEGGGG